MCDLAYDHVGGAGGVWLGCHGDGDHCPEGRDVRYVVTSVAGRGGGGRGQY